ncbi:MAG: MFS transporter, partial [Candidatus Hydrogenedentes bacterium]|nr:MFS transporter [Candidatus Hydrogenedentota bacterium]
MMSGHNPKFRLRVMMFLQYAIWGSWASAISAQLATFGFSRVQISAIFGCQWLGCIISPFIGGQIADRFMPTQIFLAIAHLVGAGMLYMASVQHEFRSMWIWIFVYALFYAPTLALTNSICFRNLKDTENEFGRIRVWGTIGWIAAGWFVTAVREIWHTETWTGGSDLLVIAASFSAIMCV